MRVGRIRALGDRASELVEPRVPIHGAELGAGYGRAHLDEPDQQSLINGASADLLANPADQALVVKFLESIDARTVPFVPLAVRQQGNQVYVAFDSIAGVSYIIETKQTLTTPWSAIGPGRSVAKRSGPDCCAEPPSTG